MKKSMKKCVGGLLIVALLLPLALSLTSCTEAFRLNRMDESERAIAFMDVLNLNMGRENSYTAVTENELVFEAYGVEMSIYGTMTSLVVFGEKPEDYFIHEETHSVVTSGEESEEMTIIEGFANGKMFSFYDTDKQNAIKLWSSLTAEDHVAYEAEISGSEDTDDSDMVATAATRTCVQNEDKTWTATYTDYSEEGLDYFRSSLGGVESMLSYATLTDVVLTMHATEDLYPTTMETTFEFEPSENAPAGAELPTFTAKVTYQDIGTTKAIEVDLTEYKEVADLRVGGIMEKSLLDFIDADEAEFKVNVSQRATYKGKTEGYAESNEGHFEVTSDGYTFDIQSEIGDETYRLRYRDGVRRVLDEKGKEIGEDELTDAEAEAFIRSLLDPASFGTTMVMDVEKDEILSKKGKSVYHLTLQTPDLTEYENMLGVNHLSGECTAKVTIENGRMTQQTVTLTMKSREGLEFVVTHKCYYNSFSNDQGTVGDVASDM